MGQPCPQSAHNQIAESHYPCTGSIAVTKSKLSVGSSRPGPLFGLNHLPVNGQDLKDFFKMGKELTFYYIITEMIMAQIRE